MDPKFVRAWELLAAVRSVATSWFPGDNVNHNEMALDAAHTALSLDPELSMAYAVIGMKHHLTGEGYAGAIRNLDKAIKNNDKNATAWLWRGITLKDMGYIDKALADFEACLAIDPAYLNCAQYRAESLFTLGRIEEAVQQLEATFPYNFHSTDGKFVSYYVRTGQLNMAYLVASLAMRNPSAPVNLWIEAIENPDADHAQRVARFNDWGEHFNLDVCDMGAVAIALRQDHCFSNIINANMMWTPDTAYFRKTQAFKDFVYEHLIDYWREHGFPVQCEALADDDFRCS
jgi:tetratricopeptide (TPR) repeat protein